MTKIDLGVERSISRLKSYYESHPGTLIDLAEEVAAQRFQQQNNRQEHSFQGRVHRKSNGVYAGGKSKNRKWPRVASASSKMPSPAGTISTCPRRSVSS